MHTTTVARWSAGRRLVAGAGVAFTAIVWTHALAGAFRLMGSPEAPLAAVPLSAAAVLVAVAVSVALPRFGVRTGLAAGALAAGAVELAAPGAWAAALALPASGAGVGAFGRWLGARLPAGVDTVLQRRRALAAGWALVAVLSLVQTGRLATFITDPSTPFVVATAHPFWHGHQCLPAYLFGAELAARGEENLYAAHHYPGLDREAAPETSIEGMVVEDPYQYPPQFLLLPGLALALTEDLTAIRTVWFGLQWSLFAGVFAALALWVGGRAGRTALWLLPAVLLAFPVTYNFQYGQFHLAAVALAVGAMVAFGAGRRATGGALLALAIAAKVFPAVLLVPLVVRRKFRELAWTAGWGAALTVVTLVAFGPAPFTAFFEYHVPRLGDGTAFAFDEAWPEVADLILIDNQGVFGVARKLGVDKPAAAWAGRIFFLGVLGLAAFAGRRFAAASRWARASVWLSLLGLASLASPGAWGDYVAVVAVWLLALLAARAVEDRRWRVPLAITAAFQVTLIGTFPMGDWAPLAVMLPLSTVGVLLMLALYGAVLVSRPASWSQAGVQVAREGLVDPARAA